MKGAYVLLAVGWASLWFTPDQQGERLMRQQQYVAAAKTFNDPLRQGVAWYRAGEFEKSTQAFARVRSPEALYNLGNTWTMLGKYDQAVQSYDDALRLRPDWEAAKENRELAVARAKLVEAKGGDFGDQQIGADEIVFDKSKSDGGQETVVAGDQAMTDTTAQAIWLRNVQTKPADFLKSKFAFQHAQNNDESSEQ